MTFDDGGIYLPAFMAGAITLLLAVLLLANLILVSDSNRVFESVNSGRPINEASPSFSESDFDEALRTANVVQLEELLISLNDDARQNADIPTQVLVNRRCVEVANQLWNKSLTEPQREFVIISKIKSLSVLYGLNLIHNLKEPNVAETLKSTAGKYLKDANKNISQTARLALLKHDAFEPGKHEQLMDPERLASQVVDLLSDYPDDDAMISTISAIVSLMNKLNPKGHVFAVMEKIKTEVESKTKAESGDFRSPKVLNLIRQFSDESKLNDVGFDSAFENRWINGPVGEDQIVNKALELLADPQAGKLIVEKANEASNWFEQENQYEQAQTIYEAMQKAADVNDQANVAAMARKLGSDGLIRIKLVDQKMELSGNLTSGELIHSTSIERRGVVIVFWSTQDKASIEALAEVTETTEDWRDRGGVVIAVNIDERPESRLQSIIAGHPGLQFVNSDSVILKQCPTNTVPRAMLVNRDGRVIDINVPIPDLKTEISFHLSNR